MCHYRSLLQSGRMDNTCGQRGCTTSESFCGTERQSQSLSTEHFMKSTLTIVPAITLALLISSAVDAACCYFSAKDKDVSQPAQKAFITWDPDAKKESFTVQPK